MLKKNKGITLVALIITIIILLILAVVAIGAVNNTGIIKYAQNASTEYEKKQTEEEGILKEYEEILAEKTGAKVSSYTDEGIPVPLGFKVETGTKTAGLVIKHKTEGSEFVWVPVADINEMVMCKIHGTSKTIDKETLECEDCGENTELTGIVNNITTYSDTSYREPGIVTKVWNSETSAYDKDGADMDPTYLAKAGVVDLVQNEGETAGTINEYDFQKQLKNEFNKMVASVAKYGGFYVGRYETSLTEDKSKVQSISGVAPATAASSSADTWYGLYAKSKTYSQSGVVSEMIWGCQYDAMMRFIGDKASESDNVSHDLSNVYSTGGTDYTGTVAYDDIANNIYDLEGNVLEWTQEALITFGRVNRGGNYRFSSSPSIRYSSYPTDTYSTAGSRLTLYVEL